MMFSTTTPNVPTTLNIKMCDIIALFTFGVFSGYIKCEKKCYLGKINKDSPGASAERCITDVITHIRMRHCCFIVSAFTFSAAAFSLERMKQAAISTKSGQMWPKG